MTSVQLRDLAQMQVTVQITTEFRIRRWLFCRLLWLAAWVSKAEIRIETEP